MKKVLMMTIGVLCLTIAHTSFAEELNPDRVVQDAEIAGAGALVATVGHKIGPKTIILKKGPVKFTQAETELAERKINLWRPKLEVLTESGHHIYTARYRSWFSIDHQVKEALKYGEEFGAGKVRTISVAGKAIPVLLKLAGSGAAAYAASDISVGVLDSTNLRPEAVSSAQRKDAVMPSTSQSGNKTASGSGAQ